MCIFCTETRKIDGHVTYFHTFSMRFPAEYS